MSTVVVEYSSREDRQQDFPVGTRQVGLLPCDRDIEMEDLRRRAGHHPERLQVEVLTWYESLEGDQWVELPVPERLESYLPVILACP